MNRNERQLLRDATNAVAHHNEHAWWALKHQIWDYGEQSYYVMQGEFDQPAKRAIAFLPDATKAMLLNEWRTALPARKTLSDAEILDWYARAIVEEVVRRARVAAYQTENW